MLKHQRIPLSQPYIAGNEQAYVSKVISQKQLGGDGPFTLACHDWLESKLGCHKAFLTHSGTAALEMAALLCELKPGNEVILPSFTFPSTANAFLLSGAVPVFVDIRPDTLNIDVDAVAAAVTPKTRVILPVHYAGIPCDMDALMDIAAKNPGIRVIEDAAHAFMSTYKGRHIGRIGHMGCFSFHDTKNIVAGEGGALTVNEPALMERAEIIREKGTNRTRFLRKEIPAYEWVDIGSSLLPGEMTAAFLLGQLEAADRIMELRRQVYDRYIDAFADLPRSGFAQLPPPSYDTSTRGHIFYLILESEKTRAALGAHLRSKGISAAFHYMPLHTSSAGQKFGKTPSPMPVTNDICMRLLRLPLYPELTETDQMRIIMAVKEFLV